MILILKQTAEVHKRKQLVCRHRSFRIVEIVGISWNNEPRGNVAGAMTLSPIAPAEKKCSQNIRTFRSEQLDLANILDLCFGILQSVPVEVNNFNNVIELSNSSSNSGHWKSSSRSDKTSASVACPEAHEHNSNWIMATHIVVWSPLYSIVGKQNS